MNDSIGLRGDVEVYSIDNATGERVLRFEKRNMILDLGLTIMRELIAPTGAGALAQANNAITTFYLGGSATGSNDLTGQAATAVGQTGLQGAMIASLPITTVNYEAPSTVAFIATLDAGTGNGFDVQEMVLMTAGPPARAFARQVLTNLSGTPSAIPKTDAISLQFIWRVTLQRGA